MRRPVEWDFNKSLGGKTESEMKFMPTNSSSDDQRREYSRVEAYIPFEYRIVMPADRNYVQARITSDSVAADYQPQPDSGNHDPVLDEWLRLLNSKLDTIMRLLKLQQEGYFGVNFKAVNISGGGMSFSLPEEIPLGEVLEIKIMLTFQQPVILVIYGEVVNTTPVNGGHMIAVHYIHMDDPIRDLIVRFVFEREREIIREKRR
jgi:hypothetical protein